MRDKKVTFLTQAAMIAAIYVVLTFVFAPISFGEVQIRISEMLICAACFYAGCHTGAVRRLSDRQYYRRGSAAGCDLWKPGYPYRSSGNLLSEKFQQALCSASSYCGEYLHCTLCAPLCLWRGAADSLPDADGRYRRSGFLRYPGKLSDLCSGQIQDQDL